MAGGGVGGWRTMRNVGTKRELDEELMKMMMTEGRGGAATAVVHFWTWWCDACRQMDELLWHLALDFPLTLFLRVEAEEQPEISEAYEVSAVPYFVFFKDGKVVDTLEGANPTSLASKVARVSGSIDLLVESAIKTDEHVVIEASEHMPKENASTEDEKASSDLTETLKEQLQQLISSHKVFLFMKGTPEQPRCSFSKKVVDVLKYEGVQFGSFDVLTDLEVRLGMKKLSNWPTFPQLFCNCELLGGSDVALAMHQNGELKKVFEEHALLAIHESTQDFTDDKTTNALGREKSSSLENEAAKANGSAKQMQSTEPAILDAAKDQAKENGSSTFGLTNSLNERLQQLIKSHKVFLFMKGTPEKPKCDMSRKVVNVLKNEGIQFGSFDILTDTDVRQGMKKFFNWPTFPQLFCNGELLGGCDIALAMHENGDLKQIFQEHGLLDLHKHIQAIEFDDQSINALECTKSSTLDNKVEKIDGSTNHVESTEPTVLDVLKENGSSTSGLTDSLNERLRQLINSHSFFLFVKGTPEQPKCGFSKQVVNVLKNEGVQFGSFDILTDIEVRQGIKKFSNWPTFPQLFCNGELLGGCDIILGMHENGELIEVFRECGLLGMPESSPASLDKNSNLSHEMLSKLDSMMNLESKALSMKEKPKERKSGFSCKTVDVFQQDKIEFKSFDLLSDGEAKQRLKTFSKWNSCPQIYVKIEMIGRYDLTNKEIITTEALGEVPKDNISSVQGIETKETETKQALEERLKELISSSPAMLFMKGTPDAPLCSFNSKIVDALRKEGINFGSFDILNDNVVRQGLKVFSNWPTFPQLYYKGKFIGGCDIVLELQKSRVLQSTLSE